MEEKHSWIITAVKEDGTIIEWDKTSPQKDRKEEYKCPCCGGKVVGVYGEHKYGFFKHIGCQCNEKWVHDYNNNESWHFFLQKLITNYINKAAGETIAYKEKVFKVGDDYSHRTDIFIDYPVGEFKGTVIEIQTSNMSEHTWKERNDFYTKLGYRVLWIYDLYESNVQISNIPKHNDLIAIQTDRSKSKKYFDINQSSVKTILCNSEINELKDLSTNIDKAENNRLFELVISEKEEIEDGLNFIKKHWNMQTCNKVLCLNQLYEFLVTEWSDIPEPALNYEWPIFKKPKLNRKERNENRETMSSSKEVLYKEWATMTDLDEINKEIDEAIKTEEGLSYLNRFLTNKTVIENIDEKKEQIILKIVPYLSVASIIKLINKEGLTKSIVKSIYNVEDIHEHSKINDIFISLIKTNLMPTEMLEDMYHRHNDLNYQCKIDLIKCPNVSDEVKMEIYNNADPITKDKTAEALGFEQKVIKHYENEIDTLSKQNEVYKNYLNGQYYSVSFKSENTYFTSNNRPYRRITLKRASSSGTDYSINTDIVNLENTNILITKYQWKGNWIQKWNQIDLDTFEEKEVIFNQQ